VTRPLSSEPRLVVELPLEGLPVVRVVAETAEDEARLMWWLYVERRAQEILAAADWREETAA
jgi:hypothetical protein